MVDIIINVFRAIAESLNIFFATSKLFKHYFIHVVKYLLCFFKTVLNFIFIYTYVVRKMAN